MVLFDAGKECGADANMARLLASEASWHAADAALQTFAKLRLRPGYDIERNWPKAHLCQTVDSRPT